ncbi:hypothetical protein Tco_1493092 [Tanacetum coccineum]
MLFTIFQRASLALRRLELKDLQVIIDNFPKSDMLELKIFCNRWMRHSIQQKSFLGLLFCPLEVVNEAHDQCMEEKKFPKAVGWLVAKREHLLRSEQPG